MHTGLFNIAFGVYIILKSWHFSAGGISILIDSYLADLLAMPVILTFTESAMRFIKGDDFSITGAMTIGAVIYAVLVFEVIMPVLNTNKIADPIDVAIYSVGAIVWWKFGRTRSMALSK